MPQDDRHRTRIVPIEFVANERFSALPLANRVSVVLISDGTANLLLNGKAAAITAPCALLISQYDELRLVDERRLAAKSFSFHPTFLNSALTFERLANNDFFEIEDEHDRNMMNLFLCRDDQYNGTIDLNAKTYLRISEWLAIMGTEVFAQSDGYWTCRIRKYLLQTLYLLDDLYIDRHTPNSVQRQQSPIDVVLEYLHVNYAGAITLDDLCSLVHINRTSLTRMFKAQLGYTAMEYLLKYRLKIACEALSHTNLSLFEIAQAVGFNYDTYFIKQFTSKMGLTPTEFRQKGWDEKSKRSTPPEDGSIKE